MRTIEKTVYTFEELPEAIQAKVIERFTEYVGEDPYWADSVTYDAAEIANLFGLNLRGKDGRRCIWWGSYPWSVSFDGVYSYAPGGAAKVRSYAPIDEELHAIADELQALQRRHFYGLEAVVTSNSWGSMESTVGHRWHGDDFAGVAEAEGQLADIWKRFARWIAKNLENEYDHLTDPATVREHIIESEREFFEDGETV